MAADESMQVCGSFVQRQLAAAEKQSLRTCCCLYPTLQLLYF